MMDKLEYGWFKEQIKNLMGIDLNDYSTRQLDHRLTFIMKQADVKTYRNTTACSRIILKNAGIS